MSISLSPSLSSSSGHPRCTNKQLELKVSDLAFIRKMQTLKILKPSVEKISQLDYYDKILKLLRKESKEKKMTDFEINTMFSGLYEDIAKFYQECLWEDRLSRTDFESYFNQLEMFEEGSTKCIKLLEEVIELHEKRPPELLLNCHENVLAEQKNDLQYFDIGTLCKKSIQMLVSLPFATNTLSGKCNEAIENIVYRIAQGYNIVPYHNFTHGFGVFLSFYCFTTKIKTISEKLTAEEVFFSCLACLAHDINHTANNTLFEVKVESDLAVTYGHFSVMEKMHLSRTMEILEKNEDTQFLFETMTVAQRAKARRVISRAILATDMARHYDIFDRMNEKSLTDSEEDREFLIEVLTHACDIENPALDYHSYISWAQLICLEFHDQTVREQQWNVQVTNFLKFDSLPYFYKNQLSFANSVVLPFWRGVSSWIREIDEKEIPERIKRNTETITQAMRRNSSKSQRRPIQVFLNSKLAN